MRYHDKVLGCGIGSNLRIVQLPQADVVAPPRMEARAFEKIRNLSSYVVIS